MGFTSGKYEFTIEYGNVKETVDYFVTVFYAPEIVSFEVIPEFVKVLSFSSEKCIRKL